MGEARRRKFLLGEDYGKPKVSFQQFAQSSLRTFDKQAEGKGVLNLFFKKETKIFDVYPFTDEMFLEVLQEDNSWNDILWLEYQKITDSNVLAILITVDKPTASGVFFGFNALTTEIPNWLMAESFDFEFFKKIVNGEFYIWLDHSKKQMYLRFCDQEVGA